MNPEHLELLRKSIQEFNEWRGKNYDLKPDLSGADLRGMNLFKANLCHADLSGADLRGSTLISIEARNADFEQADIRGALLQNANLSMSNLSRANLRGSNLTGAFVQDCSLVEADLCETDCTCTKFRNSNFTDATFIDSIVKGASFEGSNIDQAHIYYEQFQDANIPLELMGTMEKKTKPKPYIIYAFISIAIAFIFLFVFFQWVMKAEKPGETNTKMKAGMYKHYGKLLLLIGMKEKGLENLDVVIMLKPDSDKDKANVHGIMASEYRNLGEQAKAAYHYDRMLKLDPTHKKAPTARSFLTRYRERGGRKPKK